MQQLFEGTFYQCTDNSVYSKDACVGTYTQTVANFNSNLFTPATTSSTLAIGLELPRTWVVPDENFDHLGSSLLTLFKVIPKGTLALLDVLCIV